MLIYMRQTKNIIVEISSLLNIYAIDDFLNEY